MGSGGEGTHQAQSPATKQLSPSATMEGIKDAGQPAFDHVRSLGQTEEGWMRAFDCGTGHTALGVLMRRQLDRDTVQRALDSVLRDNPRARTVLLVPGKKEERKGNHSRASTAGDVISSLSPEQVSMLHRGKALFLVPEEANVRVRLQTGWQPRESMEQLALAQKGASEEFFDAPAFPTEEKQETAAAEARLDTCFEIGRRWEHTDAQSAAMQPQLQKECSCGCGCGSGVAASSGPAAAEEQQVQENGEVGEGGSESQKGEASEQGEGDQQTAEETAGKCEGQCRCGVRSGRYKLSLCRDKWLQIVEAAMNDPWEDDEADDEFSDSTSQEDAAAEGVGAAEGEVEGVAGEAEAREEASSTADGSSKAEEGEQSTKAELSREHEGDGVSFQTMQLLRVTLHRLPPLYSLLVMQVHTMACDRVSAALLMEEILKALKEQLFPGEGPTVSSSPGVATKEQIQAAEAAAADERAKGDEGKIEEAGEAREEGRQGERQEEEEAREQARRRNVKSVEDCIPKNLSRKPFWAHGVDVLGYGLGSRRHAYLPFRNTHDERRSQLIRSGLSRPDTDLLLKACDREKSSMHAVLTAAVLKAAAQSKDLGHKGEHFGVTTLMDLRPMLPEELHPRTMGFYHSAMMNTHHVSEETDLWDLARRCHESLTHAIAKRKQFTDMGDLLMLMNQAMSHPNLTPSGSLRTSLLSIFKDALFEKMEPYTRSLDVEDYIGCASVHGVGPCIGVFDSIREDGLHMANVYPAPLFSRSQMRRLIIHTMELLHKAIATERGLAVDA